MAFGDCLRTWRQERGLSQEQLAHDISVTASFVGMLERGEKTTTLTQIGKIADALSIEVKDLFLANEEVPHTYREAEVLVQNILANSSPQELKLFIGLCEVVNTYVSRETK